jgi:uncharacterized protein with PIN domain
MQRVLVRFYAELNDFVVPERRGRDSEFQFYVTPAVKDLIEGCGVPHTEVDLVLVNGCSAGFDHRLRNGDRVSVYPVFEAIDIGPVGKVRPEPLRETRFVLDVHLGKLAGYLRMFGFDAAWSNDADDAELAARSKQERRILLTRDRGLLKRSLVTHGHFVRETEPRRQLADVVRRFDLAGQVRPLTRCLECNCELETLDRDEAGAAIPPKVRERYSRFQRCHGCGRMYWEGSHHDRMLTFIDAVLEEAG